MATKGHNVTNLTNSCESSEAEVESVKELPVLAVGEDRGARRPDDHREEEHHQDQVHLKRMTGENC